MKAYMVEIVKNEEYESIVVVSQNIQGVLDSLKGKKNIVSIQQIEVQEVIINKGKK